MQARLSVSVSQEFLKTVKLYAINSGLTIREYVIGLIEKDMKNAEKESEWVDSRPKLTTHSKYQKTTIPWWW